MIARPRVRRSAPVPLAVALVIACFPFVAWWLIGDVTEAGTRGDPDYIAKAPEISAFLTAVVGGSCLVVSVLAAAVIVHAVLAGRDDPRWIIVALFGVLAGLVLAGGLRVVTAGTAGADIGGGMVIMFGPVLLIVLIVNAVVALRRMRNGPVSRSIGR